MLSFSLPFYLFFLSLFSFSFSFESSGHHVFIIIPIITEIITINIHEISLPLFIQNLKFNFYEAFHMCIFSETECIIFEMPNYIIISSAMYDFPFCKNDFRCTIMVADSSSFAKFVDE